MTNVEIVVVEDEPKIAQLLSDYLQREGYRVTVLGEGTHAVETIKDNQPAFLILDLMLPGKDGLTICKEVRKFSDVPIMLLTAKTDEVDRLIGLEVGADDYVCKPFSPREVVARVKIILRRVQGAPAEISDDKKTYRNVCLYIDKYKCEVSGQAVELTPVEFRLLNALMSSPGRVYSRNGLMELAYEDRRIVSDRTIDTHIKNLRNKLSQGPSGEDLIHSIYGVGYKIE
ncbi:MAG: response regulator [Woeseia sp.]